MLNSKILKKYKELSVIPTISGTKEPKDKDWNYRRYDIKEFSKEDNISIHTGIEVKKSLFLCTLDIDVSADYGIINEIAEYFKDTNIVKSGGNHNGYHVHYFTESPIRSCFFTSKLGLIEVKGIGEDNTPDAIMLPPSIVETEYVQINPTYSNYVDFDFTKTITASELYYKIHHFIEKINNL